MIELPTLLVEQIELLDEGRRLALGHRDPGAGETNVPIDSLLHLEVVDAGFTGVQRQGFRVWVNDHLAVDGGASPEVSAAFAGPLSAVTQTEDTLRVVLHPVAPLGSLAQVTVRVSAQTSDGLEHLAEQYTFEVEDRSRPRLISAHATAPRTLRLAFDEEVVLAATSAFSLIPQAAPAITPIVVSATAEGPLVELTLATEMTPGMPYQVAAKDVFDRSGNAVGPPLDHVVVLGFTPARPARRRFDLWEMLPTHNRRDDLTGDLQRFVACLQEVVDLLLADIDRWPEIYDLERAPPVFLDLILQDLGNPFAFDLDVQAKRRLAAVLVELYGQKGTAPGIRNAVRFFLGIDVIAIRSIMSETLTLGEARLGEDWVLGPSERFARYAFDVVVARRLTTEERVRVRQLVDYLRPAHTHFVELVEPREVPPPAHWELGLSSLGDTALLH